VLPVWLIVLLVLQFVRMAATFNATIVPFSSIGSADSVKILGTAKDLYNLPLGLGDRYVLVHTHCRASDNRAKYQHKMQYA
jgi:hypothetical protein